MQYNCICSKKRLLKKSSYYIQNNSTMSEISHIDFTAMKVIFSLITIMTDEIKIHKVGPTVANHAGFISVKLDDFCYFGAELNFFVELRRTKRSYYINGETRAYYIHILVGGLLTEHRESANFLLDKDTRAPVCGLCCVIITPCKYKKDPSKNRSMFGA